MHILNRKELIFNLYVLNKIIKRLWAAKIAEIQFSQKLLCIITQNVKKNGLNQEIKLNFDKYCDKYN